MWVKDLEQGWVKGVVQSVSPTALDVKLESGTVSSFKPEECPLQNPTARMGAEVRPTAAAPRGTAHTGFGGCTDGEPAADSWAADGWQPASLQALRKQSHEQDAQR